MKTTTHDIGLVIDCECDSADTLNEQTVDLAASLGFERGEMPDEDSEDYGQCLSEQADEAVDFLNSLEDLPPHCNYFFENNCLFCSPNIDSVKEDVGFVSCKSHYAARQLGIETDPDDASYPPADYQGEWLFVNDHGNCTLFVREDGKDREIWSIV